MFKKGIIVLTLLSILGVGFILPKNSFAALGDYTGTSFSTDGPGNGTVSGLTFYNTFFWSSDYADDEVYKYNADGTYADFSFDTAGSGSDFPTGIVAYNTFFWITDATDDEVYKYNADGTYASVSFDTAASGSDNPHGIATYNDFLWVADFTDGEVYKYNPDGTYTGTSFDTTASGASTPYDIVYYNSFFWITDSTDDEVYKFNTDGTYTGTSFDTQATATIFAPQAITAYNDFLWISNGTGGDVYKFNPDGTYTGTSFSTDGDGNSYPSGIVFYDSYFWVSDLGSSDPGIFKYNPDGTYTNIKFNFSASGNSNSHGVTAYNDFFWTADIADSEIYKHNPDGTYASFSFDTAGSGANSLVDVTYYDGYFWILSNTIVYKYNPDGTYTGISFDTTVTTSQPTSIVGYNNYLWITDTGNDEVYLFTTGGVYTSVSFDTGSSGNNDPQGIAAYNDFFWITDSTDDEVYKYEGGIPVVPPVVSVFSPADDEAEIALDSNLSITFSENVEVGSGNITIYNSSDDSIFENFDISSNAITGWGTSTIVIDVSENFTANESYYVQIGGGAILDADDNAFAGIANTTTWNFSTITPPSVNSFSPADNSTDFDINLDDIFITFDESVEVGTGYVTVYKTEDNSVVEALNVEDVDYVEVINPDVYLYLTDLLEADTDYYIKIDATAFDDLAGNSFAGIADEATWNFQTYDDVSPIASFSPADNENGVSTNTDLVFHFDEAVSIDGGQITIYKTEGDLEVETVDLSGGQVSGDGTNTITINLVHALERATSYYVLVDDSFYDENNNYHSGISDKNVWNFIIESPSSSGSTRTVKKIIPQSISTVLPQNSGAPCTGGALFSNLTGAPCIPTQVDGSLDNNVNPTAPSPDASKFIFTKNLWAKMIDDEVVELQKYLNTHGYSVALIGAGSLGNETNKFGNLTIEALKKFQIANGLKPDAVVGPKTREVMNGN